MSSTNLYSREFYYKAPSDEAFEELKEASLEIWDTYDDPYQTKKKDKVRRLDNVRDNFMVIVSMFDAENRKKLASKLSGPTKFEVRMRLKAGGANTSQITTFN